MTPRNQYCGRCHEWMTELFTDKWVCDCTLSGHNPDKSKDPNCHNSSHAHHDPLSPIVLVAIEFSKQEEAAEERPFYEVIDELDEVLAEANEQCDWVCPWCDNHCATDCSTHQWMCGTEVRVPPMAAEGFVARDGPTDRPGSTFEAEEDPRILKAQREIANLKAFADDFNYGAWGRIISNWCTRILDILGGKGVECIVHTGSPCEDCGRLITDD